MEQENGAIVPASVTLEVRPAIGGTQTPYQRMLRLGQQLAAEGKRADLAELDVNGGPLSLTHGVFGFNFWAGEERKVNEKRETQKRGNRNRKKILNPKKTKKP